MLQIEIEKGNEMEKDLIKKYEAILPDELLEIWENYGFANLLDGYLRVINPEDYLVFLISLPLLHIVESVNTFPQSNHPL